MKPQTQVVQEVMNKIQAYAFFGNIEDSNSESRFQQKYKELIKTIENLVEKAQKAQDAPVTTPAVQFSGTTVMVPYMTITKYQQITDDEYRLIVNLYPDNKVQIIKYIQGVYKIGLKEIKDICDTICGLD